MKLKDYVYSSCDSLGLGGAFDGLWTTLLLLPGEWGVVQYKGSHFESTRT